MGKMPDMSEIVSAFKASCKDTLRTSMTLGSDRSDFHKAFGEYFNSPSKPKPRKHKKDK